MRLTVYYVSDELDAAAKKPGAGADSVQSDELAADGPTSVKHASTRDGVQVSKL